MEELNIGALLMGLAGGLAIFLYGMEKMTASLKVLAGERMKNLLARMTSNRFKAVLTGAAVTATIQSSSVTTVLVVGFISAGLLSLSQSIGIIMGAEIGTTITAQIIAFKVTRYSLALVASGCFLAFVPKSAAVRRWGAMIMGLGLIFFGMELMKDATSPLRSYQPFIEGMQNLRNPALAVLFSATFTALVQSSSATTGVIIVLASQGFLTLEAGIALVFGANIGTCITAFLASIGKPREGGSSRRRAHSLQQHGGLALDRLHRPTRRAHSLNLAGSPGPRRHGRASGRDTTPDRQRPHRVQRGQYAHLHRLHAVDRPSGGMDRAGP